MDTEGNDMDTEDNDMDTEDNDMEVWLFLATGRRKRVFLPENRTEKQVSAVMRVETGRWAVRVWRETFVRHDVTPFPLLLACAIHGQATVFSLGAEVRRVNEFSRQE